MHQHIAHDQRISPAEKAEAVCRSKRQYTKKAYAKEAAKKAGSHGVKLEVYVCPVCRLYHLATKRTQRGGGSP